MADKKKISGKKLCKLCKGDCLKNNLEQYIKLVDDPTYVCKKCGRVANKAKSLCKAEKIIA